MYTCWDVQALHVDTNVAIAYSVDTITARAFSPRLPVLPAKPLPQSFQPARFMAGARRQRNSPAKVQLTQFVVLVSSICHLRRQEVLNRGQEGAKL
jgi:hypothetical protein